MKKQAQILSVFLIMSVALFFCSFRLSETQLFVNDTSRDTLTALRIWQNKQITLIGASASFSQNTVQELFFGSLYLYIAILGLIIARFDPVGAVIPNIFLCSLSIPIFYLFIKRLIKSNDLSIAATFLYALSPVVVTHARFFWNPNLLIPISVFFWYLILSKPNEKFWPLKILLSGLIAGLMFNLHYFSIVPIAIYLIYLLVRFDKDRFILFLGGLLLGLSPLILFELRNNFYLLGALKYNLNHGIVTVDKTFPLLADRFVTILSSFIGLSHGEIPFSTIFITAVPKYIFGLTLLILCLNAFIKRIFSRTEMPLIVCLFVTLIFTVFTSTYDLYLRYMFSVVPLLIWILVKLLSPIKYKYISLIVFIPILFSDYAIITTNINFDKDYLPLETIREISEAIVNDRPSGKYNITENIHGDARATAFRYFLLRDAAVKPQDETQYGGITTLYVVTPSIEKTFQENRWELNASGPKDSIFMDDFGPVKLYKLIKKPVR